MQSINQARSALHEDRQEISQRYAEVQQVEQEKQREEKRITGLKTERQGQAASLKKERAKHEAAMKELQAAQKSLAALIRRRDPAPHRARFRAAVRSLRGSARPPTVAGARGGGRGLRPAHASQVRDLDREQGNRYRRRLGRGGAGGRGRQGRLLGLAHGLWKLRDLNHGGGYYTLYAHLASVSVMGGQQVGGGAIIGTVGDTGSLKGTLLHFEVRQGARAMDPESWLGR